MSLHQMCLNSLNHEITQALACGQRIANGESKQTVLAFGLLHLFVVSGAHLHFVKNTLTPLRGLDKKSWFTQLLLWGFVAICAYSPPILRVFIDQFSNLIFRKCSCFVPKLFLIFLSYSLGLVVFRDSPQALFSLNLSGLFGLLVFTARGNTSSFFYLKLYLLSLPLFLKALGLPHIANLILTPLIGFTIGSLLLPLSLLSLLNPSAEKLSIWIWWELLNLLKFWNVFFNFPETPYMKLHYFKAHALVFFNLSLFAILSLGGVVWRRQSYSFSQ